MMHGGERDSQTTSDEVAYVLSGPGFAGNVLHGCRIPTMAGLERRIVGGTGEKLMNSLAVRDVLPQKAASCAYWGGQEGSASFLKKRRPARGSKKLLFVGGGVAAGVKSAASGSFASSTPRMARTLLVTTSEAKQSIFAPHQRRVKPAHNVLHRPPDAAPKMDRFAPLAMASGEPKRGNTFPAPKSPHSKSFSLPRAGRVFFKKAARSLPNLDLTA
jgi:hypothetical protein